MPNFVSVKYQRVTKNKKTKRCFHLSALAQVFKNAVEKLGIDADTLRQLTSQYVARVCSKMSNMFQRALEIKLYTEITSNNLSPQAYACGMKIINKGV